MMKTAHFQTVGAFFMRGRQSIKPGEKHIVHLDDGDRLVIHDNQPSSWITGDRIVILFHGLCGCHGSPYIVRAAEKFHQQGIRTIRVDMRGFGDSTLISKSHLHGGCYRDAFAIVDFVHRLCPISKISLVGYSIGGNIVLKALGMWGVNSPSYVDSAVAISPPIDLVHCSWNIRSRGNRIYEAYFMKQLRAKLVKRRRIVKDLVDNGLSPLPSRMIHWDNQFTAPCWGYDNAYDYYRDASSGEQLDEVNVSTVILTAEDDPVVPFEMYENFSMSDQISFVSTRYGGHLGFISQGKYDPDRHWMDWRICQWITSPDDNPIVDSTPEFSYSPRRRQRRTASQY